MSDAEVAERLGEVRGYWKRSVGSTTKAPAIRAVYRAFLTEDADLAQKAGERLARLDWWVWYDKARTTARRAGVGELATVLRSEHGELGLITDAELDALVRDRFPDLAPAEVRRALAKAEVRSGLPVELPRTSGLSPQQDEKLGQLLSATGARSIPALLHGSVAKFFLLKEFRADPPSSARPTIRRRTRPATPWTSCTPRCGPGSICGC